MVALSRYKKHSDHFSRFPFFFKKRKPRKYLEISYSQLRSEPILLDHFLYKTNENY